MASYAWTGWSCVAALGRHAMGGDATDLARHTRRWARRLERMWRLELSVEGLEHYREGTPTVLVANHQSYIDVVALFLVLPEMPVFLAKRELSRVPLFSRVMRTRGDVFIDRQRHDAAATTIDRTARILKPGSPLLVFPEGTRTREPRIGPFKKGAFHLAKQAHAALQPIGIHGSLEAWPREAPAPRGGPVRVSIGPALSAETVQAMPIEELVARARADVAQLASLPLA
ncbi:MAG: 1-acyl-sn-glycerol-3-phosphate acyltransferase [Sandaracinaceae bacterium]|nr:1-acyl-sn-glycerol-3-phosphate acyltransferase [Sandaracinaceae bacterium]